MRLDPGGTANLAVLGGNLPPSFGTARAPTKSCISGAPGAVGESPVTTGPWPVPPRPLLHRSGSEGPRAEKSERGIGAALSKPTISAFVDAGIGVQAVPEPSTKVLVAVGAVVAGIFALRGRRR